MTRLTITSATPGQAVAGQQRAPLLAMLAALAAALCAGFVLAIVLPGAAALSSPWGLRWRALAQVHGQVMVVGWVGFFIIGMATRLLPRFSSTPLQYAGAIPAALALLVAALSLRGIAQPLADNRFARALLPVSGVIEIAGAALFALAALATLRRPLRERRPFAYFLAAGAVWFVIQAALTTRALFEVNRIGDMVVSGAADAPLLQVQFYGFLLCFITGVALRAIPTFFAWKTPNRLVWPVWGVLQAGLVLTVVAGETGSPGDTWPLQGIERLLLAAAMLGVTGCMGIWRPASRLRGGVQPVGLLLRAAFTWLAIAALVLTWGALDGLFHRRAVAGYFDDATRHLLALGVITALVVGMAYLVAPMFAQERTGGPGMTLRVRLYALLLSAAAFLRAGAALLEGQGVTSGRFWPMAAAGVLGTAAIALFAWRLVHGIRHPYVPIIAISEIKGAVSGPG